MKLVFVHDGPVFYDEDNNFYEFTYHGLLERYRFLADEICFLMRTKPVTRERKYTLLPKDINVISVPDFKSIKNLKNKKKAKRIIRDTIKDADYIVFRLQSTIAQIGLKYAKKYDKPYIIESVACPWDSYWNHSLLGKLYAPIAFFETKIAIKNAKYVYYVTEKFLQGRYPTKGKSVSCSNVVLKELDDSILDKRLNRQNKKSKDKIIIGTAAALDVKYKGQEYVIKAIYELNKNGYNFVYKLAGGFTGAKDNNYLKELVKKYNLDNNVLFLGALTENEMEKYYDDLDIYIQPSKQEGLPRSVIEAMGRGCPCIGSNIAGLPELLSDEFLFSKGSVRAIKQTLVNLLDMDLENVIKNNFNVAKRYTKDVLKKKRESFYIDFLKENSKEKIEGKR